MNLIVKSGFRLAQASKGNPIVSTGVICMFYLMLNLALAQIEKLIWGERFEHWLDLIFICVCIGYAAYCVGCCAVLNAAERR